MFNLSVFVGKYPETTWNNMFCFVGNCTIIVAHYLLTKVYHNNRINS